MDNPRWVLLWRLSATSTLTNQNFFALGLPYPNTPDYKPYSALVPQSQGGQARQGYRRIVVLWDVLTGEQFRTLTRIVESAITNGSIYMTLDKADGTGIINSFIDCHGVCQPLVWTPLAEARGVVISNVTLTVNSIVVDSDPSAIS